MSDADKFGLFILIFIAGPMLFDHALDFFVQGRWERRAYKRSIEELNREIKRRNK